MIFFLLPAAFRSPPIGKSLVSVLANEEPRGCYVVGGCGLTEEDLLNNISSFLVSVLFF